MATKTMKQQETLSARVWREGRFWLIEMPIDGTTRMTQAHTLKEAREMAEDLAEIFGHKGADITFDIVPPNEDFIIAYRDATQRAHDAQEELAHAARHAAQSLRSQGLTVRDTATLMGISPGRVSQLS